MNAQKCKRCRGLLESKKVEHPYWNGSTLVAVVHDVPSWVCQLCGYHFFDPAVETTLGFIVKDYVKMGTLFPIPSTPYREIAHS
jgi:YgiT-type zinc finger domain-containing protein